MNIHEAARKVLAMPTLPELRGNGLCYVFAKIMAEGSQDTLDAYCDMAEFMDENYLPEVGVWTEQRLNVVCLLACTNPEDFI